MKTIDRVQKQIRGEVKITQISPTGEQIVTKSNLVVNGLYKRLVELLAFNTTSYVNKMRFGSDGTAATIYDLNVTPIGGVNFLTTVNTFPTTTSVKFTGTWGTAETCATPIQEVGLFTSDNVLVARVVFSAMMKSAGWIWQIEWALSYS